jgi:hypothetical protein
MHTGLQAFSYRSTATLPVRHPFKVVRMIFSTPGSSHRWPGGCAFANNFCTLNVTQGAKAMMHACIGYVTNIVSSALAHDASGSSWRFSMTRKQDASRNQLGRHMQSLNDQLLTKPLVSSKAARFTTLARQGSPGASHTGTRPSDSLHTTAWFDPSSGRYAQDETDYRTHPNLSRL